MADLRLSPHPYQRRMQGQSCPFKYEDPVIISDRIHASDAVVLQQTETLFERSGFQIGFKQINN